MAEVARVLGDRVETVTRAYTHWTKTPVRTRRRSQKAFTGHCKVAKPVFGVRGATLQKCATPYVRKGLHRKPPQRFELWTPALRKPCSTAELRRQLVTTYINFLFRTATSTLTSHRTTFALRKRRTTHALHRHSTKTYVKSTAIAPPYGQPIFCPREHFLTKDVYYR